MAKAKTRTRALASPILSAVAKKASASPPPPDPVTTALAIHAEYRAVVESLATLEKKRKSLIESLKLLLPADGAKLGSLIRKDQPHTSVSWKAFIERLTTELIPASRRQLIEPIRESCTTRTSTATFIVDGGNE